MGLYPQYALTPCPSLLHGTPPLCVLRSPLLRDVLPSVCPRHCRVVPSQLHCVGWMLELRGPLFCGV